MANRNGKFPVFEGVIFPYLKNPAVKKENAMCLETQWFSYLRGACCKTWFVATKTP